MRGAGGWLADRLGWDRVAKVLAHPVPPRSAGRRSVWMYVFGTATLAAFLLQLVTGVLLAANYTPAPAEAYESVLRLNEQVRFGAFLRGMHFFGASAMVVLITIHMIRVFLTGSYKFPRELNWVTGAVLMLLTIGMAFTGQLLRWDANGVWGVFVASHYAGRVPLVGEYLKQFLLAGDTIGGATLSRFYGFHVLLFPLLIFGLVGVHLYLVLHHGISEPPRRGRPVRPESYRTEYEALLSTGQRRYVPDISRREAAFATAVVAVVAALAVLLGPRGPAEPPDPTFIPAEPKPDWYLLWYYGLISIKPPRIETFVMVYLPLLLLVLLLAVPFLSKRGERAPAGRPWSVLIVGGFLIAFGVLTELGARSPWVMDFSATPLAAEEFDGRSPIVADGARLFHERGCQYCHAVAGQGGRYGPELTTVMRRLPSTIVTARTLQGFGNMPAYGGMLPREELDAILAFLAALAAEQR